MLMEHCWSPLTLSIVDARAIKASYKALYPRSTVYYIRPMTQRQLHGTTKFSLFPLSLRHLCALSLFFTFLYSSQIGSAASEI